MQLVKRCLPSTAKRSLLFLLPSIFHPIALFGPTHLPSSSVFCEAVYQLVTKNNKRGQQNKRAPNGVSKRQSTPPSHCHCFIKTLTRTRLLITL